MTKSEAIRAALAKKPLTLKQLIPILERRLKQVVGKQRLYALLVTMQNKREIDSAGRGDGRVYVRLKGKA